MGSAAFRRHSARLWLVFLALFWMLVVVPLSAAGAPYAAMVMDARTGEVLHSRNADTRLHPASLTKMMTLYIVFEAVEHGEIGLDDSITISRNAASEPPSKLGLRAGQTIRLRYLIRAAAVKSANDAATALAEAIEGSVDRFARRMNRTARAMGMTRTTFRNAHGLTETGHLSTARDMTILARHIIYDYPDYYNLFSRISADAGLRKVYHTNRRLLRSYPGADGIKTGYTNAAGFNLAASARRGGKRVIATVFGGRSTASRNARVKELLDLGFRDAPTRVALRKPARPSYIGRVGDILRVASADTPAPARAAHVRRPMRAAAIMRSLRPLARAVPDDARLATAETPAEDAQAVPGAAAAASAAAEAPAADVEPAERLAARIASAVAATGSAPPAEAPPAAGPADDAVPEVITRASTSGGRQWGVNVGRYPSQFKARQVLLKTALIEIATLDGSLRKVVRRSRGYDANFMGLTRKQADRACRRLQARDIACFMIVPAS